MSPPEESGEAALPEDFSGDVTGDGVFLAVRDGYDAVYGALPRGETFNRIWREHAYGGDFPAEFAHIGFLTVSEARRMLGLLGVRDGDVLVDLACGAGGPGLWAAQESGASTITGAGNRASGPVLRSGSPRLVISEAWAWLTATHLVRASAAAALPSQAAADEESFTAARHHAIRSMTSSQVTASSSLDAFATAADAAARAALHTLNAPLPGTA
jgi:hypothetical protein